MKNLKNLGKALTKAEQKTINGGIPGDWGFECRKTSQCPAILNPDGTMTLARCEKGYCVPA
ncbi:hypothetical protein [Lacinutrix sp. MEBiC02404]